MHQEVFMTRVEFNTIDDYISQFSPELQELMGQMRKTIKDAAPNATEKISYSMPTFYLNGNLVHFAAFKNHIGFYPGAEGVAFFQDRFQTEGYTFSKGAVQFPHNRPLPLDLVSEITRFRVSQNEAQTGKKKTDPSSRNKKQAGD